MLTYYFVKVRRPVGQSISIMQGLFWRQILLVLIFCQMSIGHKSNGKFKQTSGFGY